MRTFDPWKGAACALLLAGGLCGCADLQRAVAPLGPAPVNVESPIAAAVVAAEQGPIPYPSFRDVPPKIDAAGQPTPFQWRRTVRTLSLSGDEVATWIAENPALNPNSTEAFDTASLKALRYDPASLPPEDQADRTEAYAAALRAKAAAPPPPK